MSRTKTANAQTPWGYSDRAEIVADGIVWYSTPSHGGYKLSPARMRQLRTKFPDYKLWAGSPWFEEDCDAVLIPLAFPEYFDRAHVAYAIRFARQFLRGNWQFAEIIRHIDQNPELNEIEREHPEHAPTA